jgi:hypothetical protein
MSGLGLYNVGRLEKLQTRWWLLRDSDRRLTAADREQLHEITGHEVHIEDP